MEIVKPFVKWAGGKGGLLSQLNNFYQFDLENGTRYKKEQVNTFVYFDSPYRPLSITSGFTSYTKENCSITASLVK